MTFNDEYDEYDEYDTDEDVCRCCGVDLIEDETDDKVCSDCQATT